MEFFGGWSFLLCKILHEWSFLAFSFILVFDEKVAFYIHLVLHAY